MNAVIGIDMGTSYFKTGLFDLDSAQPLAIEAVPVNYDTPAPNHCELPVDQFWDIIKKSIVTVCEKASLSSENIKAIAYSSQANTLLLLDENDNPLTPLISWTDRRPVELDPPLDADTLLESPDFLGKTGLGLGKSPSYGVAKLQWLRTQRPHIWNKAAKICTIADYLTYSLTQNHIIDTGTAGLLTILDLQNSVFWPEACRILNINPDALAKPEQPGTVAGNITAKGSQLTTLPQTAKLVIGSLDHHIAALGAGLGSIAHASQSTGTVVACIKYSNDFTPKQNCCMGRGLDDYKYFQIAFSNNGASQLQWYRQTNAPDLSFKQLDELAEKIPPTCNGMIAASEPKNLPFKQAFLNVPEQPGHGHYARAIMESVAATLKSLIEKLFESNPPGKIVATGGGAASDLWLQIQADICQADMVRTDCPEPACKGAAMLAASAANPKSSLSEIEKTWTKPLKTFHPDPQTSAKYQSWYQKIKRYL